MKSFNEKEGYKSIEELSQYLNNVDIQGFIDSVLEWNKVAGNSCTDENYEHLRNLYINLVEEERAEVFTANNRSEFVDGLIDTMVTSAKLCEIRYSDHFWDFKDVESSITLSKLMESNALECFNQAYHVLLDVKYLDVSKALNEVLHSNWSKFPEVGDVDPDTECAHIESLGRYKNVTYKICTLSNGKQVYVFRDDNGKIVKPSTFVEPDIESCFYK